MNINFDNEGDELFLKDTDDLNPLFERISDGIIAAATAGEDNVYITVRRRLGPMVSGNSVHLCDSCSQGFPECSAWIDDVIWGDGKGNDNICGCAKYTPLAKKAGRE